MPQIQTNITQEFLDWISGKSSKRNKALSDVVLSGLRLNQTPENLPDIPPEQAAQEQFAAGAVPSSIVRQIMAETLGRGGPNPQHARVLEDITSSAREYAKYGGSPDVLLRTLQSIGTLETAPERAAREVSERQFGLQEKSQRFQEAQLGRRQEFQKRLQDDEQAFRKETQQSRQAFEKSLKTIEDSGKVTPGQAIRNRSQAIQVYDSQLKEEWAAERLQLYQQDTNAILPSFRQWKIQKGYTDERGNYLLPEGMKHLESDKSYYEYMKSILGDYLKPANVPTKKEENQKPEKSAREKKLEAELIK